SPAAYLLFVGNFDQLAKGLPDASNLGVLWSIAVEEQFYLFWPLLITLIALRRLGWVLSAIVIGSLAFRMVNRASPAVLELHTLSAISDMGIGGLAALSAKYSRGFLKTIEDLHVAAIALVYACLVVVLLFR